MSNQSSPKDEKKLPPPVRVPDPPVPNRAHTEMKQTDDKNKKEP